MRCISIIIFLIASVVLAQHGQYIPTGLTPDTLDTVTDRGNTTTNAITTGNITSTGIITGGSTEKMVLNPDVSPYGTAYIFDTKNLITTGFLASFRNFNVEKISFGSDGTINAQGYISAQGNIFATSGNLWLGSYLLNSVNVYALTCQDTDTPLTLGSNISDGANAVAVRTDTLYPLTTVGSKLFQVNNDGTEKLYIDKDGGIVADGYIYENTDDRVCTAENELCKETEADTLDSVTDRGNSTTNTITTGSITTTGSLTGGSTGKMVLNPDVAINETAYTFDTANSLTTGKIASFRNAGSEKVMITSGGSILTQGSITGGIVTAQEGITSLGYIIAYNYLYLNRDTLNEVDVYALTCITNEPLTLATYKEDSSTAVAIRTDTLNAFTTAGAKLFQVNNQGVEKSYIDKDGGLYAKGNITTEGTITGGSTGKMVLNPDVSAGDTAYVFDTLNTLTGDMAIWRNNGTERMRLYNDGRLYVSGINASGGNNFFDSSRVKISVATMNAMTGAGVSTYYNAPISLFNYSLTDSSSAIALRVDTQNSLTTAGAKLLSVANDGTEKMNVDKDGNIKAGAVQLTDTGTKPTCDATTRGMLWLEEGGTGVADTIEVCTKNADDTYTWKSLI